MDTGLKDANLQPINIGDRYMVKEHPNECCNHNVECEVLENKDCRCGYGLHDIKTGGLIANAEIAGTKLAKKSK